MRKTLALLLAAAFFYLAAVPSPSIKSQTLVAPAKFHTVANPIPNRYIVVLATTDFSPVAALRPQSLLQQLQRALRLPPTRRWLPIRVRRPLLHHQCLPIRWWLRQPRSSRLLTAALSISPGA